MPICAIFTGLVLVFAILVLHYRVILTHTEIIQYPFFSVSSVSHKYTEITEIRTAPKRRAPNGSLVDNDDNEAAIADGSIWSTYSNPADLATAQEQTMIEFVSRQGGKPIRWVPVLEKVDRSHLLPGNS